jgi:CheY-like chemotaxis protein
MQNDPFPVNTCMCVELDSDFFYLIRSFAERSGLRAEYINRGTDALAQARLSRPVVVFLEADHPSQHPAWNVLAGLKADPVTQEIPVVLFSWLDDEELALQKGADVYVRKPVMFADFLSALTTAGVCTGTNSIDIANSKRR